ncbi:MAG: TolC family protein [Acidobacteriia bacterium]|nr:TolC family protein [Terriglobia bacterium]
MIQNLSRTFGSKVGFWVVLAALSSSAAAQNYFVQPSSHFPNPVGPYLAKQVPEPTFGNTPRVESLLKDGKLMLSLGDAVTLALENNLDLAIARYNLTIADTDILRAKSGATVRGVATGLVQGTPGGGIGGFGTGAAGAGAGGTSGGAGGAGTGASGLVQSTLGIGAPVDSYDPTLNAGLRIEHGTFPLSSSVLSGSIPFLQQNLGTANFNYSQAFSFGTSMAVEFDNARSTDNTTTSSLVPQVQSGFRLTLRQRLLSGFGIGPNTRFIHIARNNREISDVAFRDQVIATVSQIQNIYWDLVNAYEDVKVKERSLSLADKTLSDDRDQVKLGAMAPIEVMRAESEVASRNQDLILAQNELQLQELLIKNAITRDLSDAVMASAPVVPTDTMSIAEEEAVTPVQDLISDALSHRPELAEGRIDLHNRDLSRKAAANALLPSVDLVAWYGASGIAGQQNLNNPDLPPNSIPRSGLPNAFATLFRNDFPDYAVGFNISIPLRNRAAQADEIRSQLEYRQAQLRLQQLQNQVGIEVRNAQFALQQNRARVITARKARDLAQQSLEIEQKKYVLGASTSYQVLQLQRDLAQAGSNFVAAMSAYEKSRVELDRVTGLTLAHTGIEIQDAESGHVRSVPILPGVGPRPETTPAEKSPGS